LRVNETQQSMVKPITLSDLKRHAVARTLFAPTTLGRAIQKLGFVQADPIRQPARAQDLTLRLRVKDYRAGDLEARYPKLDIAEDYFVNHGFLPRATQALMHPRVARRVWPAATQRQAKSVLSFIAERGVVHPRDVDAQFAHGKTTNWFGGSSNASTQLLDGMHYRGLIRIAGRASGVRLYEVAPAWAPCKDVTAHLDALVDVIVKLYAPLPERSLSELVSRLAGGTPQWQSQRPATLARAKRRYPNATVESMRWYWPEGENPASRRHTFDDELRLLAPFDPIVWDRRRFELLWGWAYRFEAYTPAAKRVRGYYAMPMLWQGEVLGWGNVSRDPQGQLHCEMGLSPTPSRPPQGLQAALAQDVERLQRFMR
jgi:uncharacterized protein